MGAPAPHVVTQLLQLASSGDARATDELLPMVYTELKQLARAHLANEAPGQTLNPTGLVHEAYLRLVGDGEVSWQSRGHFFGAAAIAMRRVLVDRARRVGSLKRGGDRRRVELPAEGDEGPQAKGADESTLLAMDELLDSLAAYDAEKANVVMLRFFAGLTLEQIAQATGRPHAKVRGDWIFARSWMHAELKRQGLA